MLCQMAHFFYRYVLPKLQYFAGQSFQTAWKKFSSFYFCSKQVWLPGGLFSDCKGACVETTYILTKQIQLYIQRHRPQPKTDEELMIYGAVNLSAEVLLHYHGNYRPWEIISWAVSSSKHTEQHSFRQCKHTPMMWLQGILFRCLFWDFPGGGAIGSIRCGEAMCHRKGRLWPSQEEEGADGWVQEHRLSTTWDPRPAGHDNGQSQVHDVFCCYVWIQCLAKNVLVCPSTILPDQKDSRFIPSPGSSINSATFRSLLGPHQAPCAPRINQKRKGNQCPSEPTERHRNCGIPA